MNSQTQNPTLGFIIITKCLEKKIKNQNNLFSSCIIADFTA